MIRIGLRWQILLLTALPLLALAGATLWFVDRAVTRRSEEDLAGDLRRASHVFENMLSASANDLGVTGAVIVKDPRFFSVLALPHGRKDRSFVATVTGVAHDFQQLAGQDVFEIVDARGEVVASVGRIELVPDARKALVSSALGGNAGSRAVPQRDTQVLLVGTPVEVDGRVVGALLLGREVSGELAAQLRELTSSEVAFICGGRITRTTLPGAEEREVARQVAAGSMRPGTDPTRIEGWIAWARPLPMAADPASQVYVLQRSVAAETAFLRAVRGQLSELGLLLLAAVALASVFIAGHITRPIRQLVNAAQAMERGEWDAPIDRDRPDEMGYLAGNFEHMRSRQRTYVRSLQEVARAKSEFIAVASHELRTPISIIRGWEDLLRGGMVKPDSKPFADGLDAIGRACDSLEKIAVSATRMAQSDGEGPPAPTTCEVAPLLADALREAMRVATGRNVSVTIEVEDDARHAILDRLQVLHAVDELVRNGIRFTSDGGSVTVRACARGADFAIEVRDTGIGLSDEARQRLLEDVYVPHDSRNHHTATGLEFNVAGMGLGLVLVRRVVEGHGGRLLVDGRRDQGSLFTMLFPGAIAKGEELVVAA
jgi:signal transduction histidine kinase